MTITYKPHPTSHHGCPMWDVYQGDTLVGCMWFGSQYWYHVEGSESLYGKNPPNQMEMTLDKLAAIVVEEYNEAMTKLKTLTQIPIEDARRLLRLTPGTPRRLFISVGTPNLVLADKAMLDISSLEEFEQAAEELLKSSEETYGVKCQLKEVWK